MNTYLFPLSDGYCLRCKQQLTEVIANVNHENCKQLAMLDDGLEWPQPLQLTEAQKQKIRQIAATNGLDVSKVEELIAENAIPECILAWLEPPSDKHHNSC
jgi:hypothetical protein